jgi:Flp pilus assembly protein TadG
MIHLSYRKDESGASAAEFTLVMMPFMVLVFAIIHLSFVFYANQSLQFATEAAARCYSVDAVNCSSAGAAQTFAVSRYKGPSIGAAFTATATGCGHTVTGTGSYQVDAIVVDIPVNLSATACFP